MGVILGVAVVVTKKPNRLGSKLNGSTRDLCLGAQKDSEVAWTVQPEICVWVAKRTRT